MMSIYYHLFLLVFLYYFYKGISNHTNDTAKSSIIDGLWDSHTKVMRFYEIIALPIHFLQHITADNIVVLL